MKKSILILLIAIFSTVALSAQSVLIAKENTAYKRALVDVLTQKLESEGLEVEVIDHKNGELDAVNPSDYDVVYVLNSGAQAQVRPEVLDWLEVVAGNDDNVIVHTTKRTEWDEDLGVDSLSSASKKSNIDEVTDDILTRIRAKL